ncbi:MAG: hypothetical protein MRZ82_01500 [Firmicutes bacterium]|nr:hypothetical protein [Bacillota bacterium]
MTVDILSVFAIVCIAVTMGKITAKVKLPAILGWLITGVVFGPYLVGVVTFHTMNADRYKITIKVFECFAGVMIGRKIIFKKIIDTNFKISGRGKPAAFSAC